MTLLGQVCVIYKKLPCEEGEVFQDEMITSVEGGYRRDESSDEPELILRLALQLQYVGRLLCWKVKAKHLSVFSHVGKYLGNLVQHSGLLQVDL